MKKYYETKNMKIECKTIGGKESWVTKIGLEMDATNMTFKDGTFDVIIDKGTLDAILVIVVLESQWFIENNSVERIQI